MCSPGSGGAAGAGGVSARSPGEAVAAPPYAPHYAPDYSPHRVANTPPHTTWTTLRPVSSCTFLFSLDSQHFICVRLWIAKGSMCVDPTASHSRTCPAERAVCVLKWNSTGHSTYNDAHVLPCVTEYSPFHLWHCVTQRIALPFYSLQRNLLVAAIFCKDRIALVNKF